MYKGYRFIATFLLSVVVGFCLFPPLSTGVHLIAQTLVRSYDEASKTPTGTGDSTAKAERVVFVQPNGTTVGLSSESLHTWPFTDLDETKRQVDADTGCLQSFTVSNLGAVKVFVKFYLLGSSSVTVGTTNPDIILPVGAGADEAIVTGAVNLGGCVPYPGLTVAATTGITGTTGPTTNSVIINVFFKD